MKITIELDPDDPRDAAALAAVMGTPRGSTPKPQAVKAAPAKETKAAEPAPEPESVEDEAEVEALKEKAVQEATRLVGEGRAADVKAALTTAGAERVSALTKEQVPVFLEAIA